MNTNNHEEQKITIEVEEEIFPEFPFLTRSQQQGILEEIRKGPNYKIQTIKALRDASNNRISLKEAKDAIEQKMINYGYTTKKQVEEDQKTGCI